MIKFRIYVDKDKETKWLNEMAAKGYAMTGFFACFYVFEKCEPGKYFYQIDITEGFFRIPESYREFMREAGVEIVCLWGPWVILRRLAEEGPFELYTDVESTIEHYTKVRNLFKFAAILELLCLFLEIIEGIRGVIVGWAGACLIGALVVVFIKEVMRINDILAELKGRMGESEQCRFGGRRPSGLLAVGMLINACGLMINNPAYDAVKGFLTGMAIVLMLAGIVLTCRGRE